MTIPLEARIIQLRKILEAHGLTIEETTIRGERILLTITTTPTPATTSSPHLATPPTQTPPPATP
jgi:hypothetical protein